MVENASSDKGYGLEGSDTIVGNAGDDDIYAGPGSRNVLTGGAGADTFVKDSRWNRPPIDIDVIKDFDVTGKNHDFIHFVNFSFDDYSDLTFRMSNRNVMIVVGNDAMVLEGIRSSAQLMPDMFIS